MVFNGAVNLAFIPISNATIVIRIGKIGIQLYAFVIIFNSGVNLAFFGVSKAATVVGYGNNRGVRWI